MALKDILYKGLVLDQLIREKRTGTVDDLATTLGMSRRQVYNYIKAIKEINPQCTFNTQEKSYVYPVDEGA